MPSSNGIVKPSRGPETLNRAAEVAELIDALKGLVVPYISAADEAAVEKANGGTKGAARTSLVDARPPEELVSLMKLALPAGDGLGKEGLLQAIQSILQYSVNTWDQGFMDKLYSSTNAVGVASDLLLSVLNTNSHVYQVSPALTVVEKTTCKNVARLFGFNGPRAGGVSISGGSASNMSSVVIARNTLFPDTKVKGNQDYKFALFTSAHGHYSVEKSAQACGMGSAAVVSVPVDPTGMMRPAALVEAIKQARAEGKTPLYVNATAGTTVLGSFDPFEAISGICKEEGLWMHIDGSWGGPVIFSAQQRHKMQGSHLADSITVNPHKMMNVPTTCSLLLGPDMKIFHKANTLPAGYLFHGSDDDEEVWDLADLTLQCGRRADSVKLALSWIYHGAAGFERQTDHAFAMAAHLADLVSEHQDFVLLSQNPPPCLQVCFYYAPGGKLSEDPKVNTQNTRSMVQQLVSRGFMVDFAPGEKGSFFRIVVNWQTLQGTVEGLIKALVEIGQEKGIA